MNPFLPVLEEACHAQSTCDSQASFGQVMKKKEGAVDLRGVLHLNHINALRWKLPSIGPKGLQRLARPP
jgi:hypothetical protein